MVLQLYSLLYSLQSLNICLHSGQRTVIITFPSSTSVSSSSISSSSNLSSSGSSSSGFFFLSPCLLSITDDKILSKEIAVPGSSGITVSSVFSFDLKGETTGFDFWVFSSLISGFISSSIISSWISDSFSWSGGDSSLIIDCSSVISSFLTNGFL